MTILLYVRRKGWPLRRVTVECSHRRVHAEDGEDCETNDRACLDEIRRHILLEGDLSEEQKNRLAYIATPSVPSSLAGDIARRSGMTLVGRAVSGTPDYHRPQ